MSKQTAPGRLIVVSNRLPVVLQKRKKKPMKYTVKPASGGLVTAFVPVLKKRGGLWIGWPGTFFEEGVDLQKFLREDPPDPNYMLSPVEITLQEYEHYYKASPTKYYGLFFTISLLTVTFSPNIMMPTNGSTSASARPSWRISGRMISSGSRTIT